ncbi:MAG: hypothetical protein WBA17_01470 [Saprospiraceae bacterium]
MHHLSAVPFCYCCLMALALVSACDATKNPREDPAERPSPAVPGATVIPDEDPAISRPPRESRELTTPATSECTAKGNVRDFSDLDGCGLLIETDAGELLLPISTPPGYQLEANTRISFGFSVVPDQMSICMREDAAVRILCLRELRGAGGIPILEECQYLDKPSGWLAEKAEEWKAHTITRYPYRTDGWAYLLETTGGQYLYDCQGTLLCQPRKSCLGLIEEVDEGVEIYRD